MREPVFGSTGSRACSLAGASRAVRQGKSNANLSIHHFFLEGRYGSDCAMLVTVVLHGPNGLYARRCCRRSINARCRPRGHIAALGGNNHSQRSVGCDPSPIDDRHLEGIRCRDGTATERRGTGSVKTAEPIDRDACSYHSNCYEYCARNGDLDAHPYCFPYIDSRTDGDLNAHADHNTFAHSDANSLSCGNRSSRRVDAPNPGRDIPYGGDGRRPD